jgi:hypothetical protein
MEWRVIRDMKRLLRKPELSVDEKARVANALAYHASPLNKLMVQKGEESHFDEATLGDFIRDVDQRALTFVRRDFRTWTRRLSRKR